MAASVYDIVQDLRGDPALKQLLGQLDELAGRLENVRHADTYATSSSSTEGPSELILPCPGEGHLPVFRQAGEYTALQIAAEAAAQQVPTHYSRDDWMRWAMCSTHAALVVDLAWHTIATTWQPSAPMAAAVQAAVVQLLSQHYVSLLLDGSIPSKDLYCRLWLTMTAQATLLLLRQVFPAYKKQLVQHMQQHIHQQLRLWVTGLMPQDAADLATASVEAAAAAASPDGAAEPDTTILATTSRVAAQQQQRAVQDMVLCKPGALVSCYLSQQQASPTRLWQQHLAGGRDSTISGRSALTGSCSSTTMLGGATAGPTAAAAADTTVDLSGADASGDSGGPRSPSYKARAAACMADAAAAVRQYERSKAAAAKGRRAARADISKQTEEMLQQLRDAVSSARTRQGCSNILSGWMDTSMSALPAQVDVATTDAKCKQHRQRSDLELRALDLSHRRTRTTRYADSLDAAAMAAAAPAAGGSMPSRISAAGSSIPGTKSSQAVAAASMSTAGGVTTRSGLSSSGRMLPGGPSSPNSQQTSLVHQLAGCTLRSSGPTAGVRIMKAARPAVEAARQQLGLLSGSGK